MSHSAEKDALRESIHEVATRAINAVYGTDDRHAFMGFRIAQCVVDEIPLPWGWNRVLPPEVTGERCPECRHAPHASLGFCPNMASDNECSCTYVLPPAETRAESDPRATNSRVSTVQSADGDGAGA